MNIINKKFLKYKIYHLKTFKIIIQNQKNKKLIFYYFYKKI